MIRLLDERSGEARLQWRQPTVKNETVHLMAWRMLFKQLVLLSSAQGALSNKGQRVTKINTRHKKSLSAITPQQESVTTGNVVYLPVRQLQAR